MPYITREDGEHFVIPSYRDVLSAKQTGLLKKDILLLSQSYGEYITLQRKNPAEYEVAFSPDTGYLLGESIWHQFKRPTDMIYCEVIPNTIEAILVIVKNGSVYLDGSFPTDSISEELIIFLTQQNNFEIYTYGDVPISQIPMDGKFSFEEKSVKSFTVLDKPVFPTLPLLKIYQLRLVDQVLKEHGIGVFPTRQIVMGIIVLGLLYLAWSYFTAPKPEPVETQAKINPYMQYNMKLVSPAPNQEIRQFVDLLRIFLNIPGWQTNSVSYGNGSFTVVVQSIGGKVDPLFAWATENKAVVNIKQDGVYLTTTMNLNKRSVPSKIYPLKEVIANFIDKLSSVYPGNHFKLSEFVNKGVYTDVILTISFDKVSPVILALIGDQTKNLPFVLQSINADVKNGILTGTINLESLGS